MAIWNTAREVILFTDSLRGSIGVLNTKSGNIEIFAGKPRKKDQKVIERDGSDYLPNQLEYALSGTQLSWFTLLLRS